jgi:hypothetical protein
MKIILLLSLMLSSSIFASELNLRKLIGKYRGDNCSVEIRDLSMQRPLNYNITFPDWKFQIVYSKNGQIVKEAILNENEKVVSTDERNVYVYDFFKADEYSRTDFKFVIEVVGSLVTDFAFLKERFIFSGYRTLGTCKINN